MRLLIAIILFLVCSLFTIASSDGYSNREALFFDVILTAIILPSIVALSFFLSKPNRNLKKFLLIFNIVLFITILSKARHLPFDKESRNSLTSTTSTLSKRVSSTHASMAIPDDWIINEPTFSDIFIDVQNQNRAAYIYVGYDKGEKYSSIEDHADSLRNIFLNSIYDTEFITEPADCGTQNVECIYRIFTIDKEGQETTSIIASLSSPNGYYRFMATTYTTQWELHSGTIFDILHSFRLENS
ncbi:MAG: hypothetical protein ACTID3_00350 [Halomonas sp.]|uniref:hypothetical protein n=1 Tax=Halomonas sp. TaxID=1486246 RepID=UPI003F8DA7DF